MPDTSRTLAQIKALLGDNNSGEISPQDLRDAIESIVKPVIDGDFDKHDGQLKVTGHSALGTTATINGEVLTGYTPSTSVVVIKESTVRATGTSILDAGVASQLTFNKADAYVGGEYAPSIYALIGDVIWDARSGTVGVNNNDAVGVVGTSRLKPTATMPPHIMYGAELGAVIESGAVQMQSDLAGVHASLAVLGTTPSAPWTTGIDAAALLTRLILGRTGTYNAAGAHLRSPSGGGIPTSLYGLYVEPQIIGSVDSWNIYSEGGTSKNKLEGKLLVGLSLESNTVEVTSGTHASGTRDRSAILFRTLDGVARGGIGPMGQSYGTIGLFSSNGSMALAFGDATILLNRPFAEIASAIRFTPRGDVSAGIYMTSGGNIPLLRLVPITGHTADILQVRAIGDGSTLLALTAAGRIHMAGRDVLLENGSGIVQLIGGTSGLSLLTDAGDTINFAPGGSSHFRMNDSAEIELISSAAAIRWTHASTQQTTVGAAGGASALPATPTKYLKVKDSAGTVLVIPAYAAS